MYRTTLRYLFARHAALMELAERQEQTAWERARYVAYFAYVPHTRKGALKSPEALGKFPWEIKRTQLSHAEREAIDARLRKEWEVFKNQKNPILWPEA